ncbi:ash family protein [Escherichia coli]|nr:ash family protein [Escherichia coli]EII2948305.1 host cell division inhibitor Icd-like protein [Escherichia coli]HAX3304242.1 ash family protein [Escherichia coli]HAX3313975.1 ash family protein [Escherichia coli]HCB8159761.1 host cell division inhibitor Icd-like protein [Escherichia coli]
MRNALTVTKRESAPLPERLSEQFTCRAKNQFEQGDYINRMDKRHNCRITGKTKATAEGRQWVLRQIQRITNNATFAAGGQCDQCGSVRCHNSIERSFAEYSLRYFSRAKAHGANRSDSCSCATFLRRPFRVCDGVFVNSLSFMVSTCIAMRRSYSHHGAGDGYSCSLALRRWSSSRATVTSCPISSAALTPIFSTCASASSEETRGFSPLPSAWRRAISPRMAVTINPALLSPSSFTDSMPSITSWGTRTVVNCDLAFLLVVAITETPQIWCVSVYTKKKYKKGLTCVSLQNNMKHTKCFIEIQTTKPGSARTLTGLLTTNDSKSIEVAMLNHTTHPQGRDSHNLNKYIWRFIALSTAQPRVITIEATSEQEARQQSPDGCVMVFAARIRQEVRHVQ